ncbi:HNH endonuclease signature motif containing protein [Clostridium perfringens]
MNMTSFKDVSDNIINRFSECQLGKSLEGKRFDYPVSEYDKALSKICECMKNCPIEGGRWEGERGDSKWIPDSDYVPQKSNPFGKTWSEILDSYGIDGIVFKDGEADFSEVSKGNVEIENFSTKREDNFDKADIELAKQRGCTPKEVADWRKTNGYTWHECKDMKTMQKVPREIHNNITHRGGISEAKKGANENS